MRQYLAFLCGKVFLFWYNLCGILDRDMAFGVLDSMYHAIHEVEVQENYREAMKDKIRTPGR